jgi:hypothetical protein
LDNKAVGLSGIVLATCFFLAGCASTSGLKSANDETPGVASRAGEWEKQLSLIMADDRAGDLKLKGFKRVKRIGNIKQLERAKSEIIKNALFFTTNLWGKQNQVPTEEMQKSMRLVLDKLIPTSKDLVAPKGTKGLPSRYLFEAKDMSTVELEWIYWGIPLKTIALVSDKQGVVYDYLLYFTATGATETTTGTTIVGNDTLAANLLARSRDSARYTNLFEHGEALTSETVNFDNLFKNFPLLVSNAGNIKLLSYDYVGVAQSRKQIIKLVSKNIYPNAPAWETNVSFQSETGKATILRIDLNIFPLSMDKSFMKDAIKMLSEGYAIGSNVYKIKFDYLGKTFDYYVFVNPETKRVFTKGNMFGIRFPTSV